MGICTGAASMLENVHLCTVTPVSELLLFFNPVLLGFVRREAESAKAEARGPPSGGGRVSCGRQPRRGRKTGERSRLHSSMVQKGIRSSFKQHDACLQGRILGAEENRQLGERRVDRYLRNIAFSILTTCYVSYLLIVIFINCYIYIPPVFWNHSYSSWTTCEDIVHAVFFCTNVVQVSQSTCSLTICNIIV